MQSSSTKHITQTTLFQGTAFTCAVNKHRDMAPQTFATILQSNTVTPNSHSL